MEVNTKEDENEDPPSTASVQTITSTTARPPPPAKSKKHTSAAAVSATPKARRVSKTPQPPPPPPAKENEEEEENESSLMELSAVKPGNPVLPAEAGSESDELEEATSAAEERSFNKNLENNPTRCQRCCNRLCCRKKPRTGAYVHQTTTTSVVAEQTAKQSKCHGPMLTVAVLLLAILLVTILVLYPSRHKLFAEERLQSTRAVMYYNCTVYTSSKSTPERYEFLHITWDSADYEGNSFVPSFFPEFASFESVVGLKYTGREIPLPDSFLIDSPSQELIETEISLDSLALAVPNDYCRIKEYRFYTQITTNDTLHTIQL